MRKKITGIFLVMLMLVQSSWICLANEGESWLQPEGGVETEAQQVLEGEMQQVLEVTAPAGTELYAQAAVLMDASSGRVLYEKNGEEVLAMASTTKIMTCIIALENADLEEHVDVSAYAASMPKVKLYIKKGESYRLGDLLYSLMLESHNDSAVAIAEHIGKRFLSKELQEKSVADYTTEESKKAVAAFAALMNEKAECLECEDTWFITPNGLDATETFRGTDGTEVVKNHTTTAKDLATMMSYCVLHSPKSADFLKITQTTSYTVTSLEGRNSFCTNHNAFLNMMEGAISGKTGFTNKAGYCYVGAVEREGKTYVVSLLACGWPNNKTYKWSDTKKLMNYGIEEFEFVTFEEAEERVKIPDKIRVEDGQTGTIGQQAYVQTQIVQMEVEGNVFGVPERLLLCEGEEIQVQYNVLPMLEAPVRKGDVVGSITYKVGEEVYRQEDIVVMADVQKIDLEWCVDKIIHDFLEI